MKFAIYHDAGTEIHGYFVPDNFSSKPNVLVSIDGDKEYLIECTEYIAGAVEQRLHETGIVGFIVNNDKLPNFDVTTQIEISDPESGLVIYRRFDSEKHITQRVMRMETHFVPHIELDTCFKNRFQFHAIGIERFGFETTRQMIEVVKQPSTYVSGRILYKSFQIYIDANIETSIISFRDPFYELAVRLFTLSRYNKKVFSYIPKRDAIIFNPVIEHFQDLDIFNEKEVRNRLKTAKKETIRLLESPFSHQLAASTPADKPGLDSISTALHNLSQFTCVNSGVDDEAYKNNISTLLGVPTDELRLSGKIEKLKEFAELLKSESITSIILENDLILHHFIQQAENKASA